MHNRLKVRTTAEQEERKRLEREKKLSVYKYAMSKCLDKVKEKNYDEEGLKISEQILANNGDLPTLWNYRKNVIESYEKRDQQEPQVGGDEAETETTSKDTAIMDLVKLYLNEMSLTELCLKKNPKSYCCWHHRRWCLLKSDQYNYSSKAEQLSWPHELKLCNQFLNTDERNFHCWRHRLFVVDSGRLSKLNELEFTYEKICSNFSNYSAWHYRSRLIQNLYYENQIDSEIFKKELNLIENAIFTDPNDQSAWIYEKWLLLEHQRSAIKELVFNIDNGLLTFKFAKELNLNNCLIFLKLNNLNLISSKLNNSNEIKWLSDDNNGQNENNKDIIMSKQWHANLYLNNNESISTSISQIKSQIELFREQRQIKIEISIKHFGSSSIEILLEKNVNDSNLYEFKSKFQMKDLRLDNELIESHLNNILDLSKLELDKSKWCLLTSIELMSIINFDKYKMKIFEFINKLANQIDVFRRNYYLDLKQKILANNNYLEEN